MIDGRLIEAGYFCLSAMRGFEAGPEGAEFIAIGAPNTGPGDADTVQGWWS